MPEKPSEPSKPLTTDQKLERLIQRTEENTAATAKLVAAVDRFLEKVSAEPSSIGREMLTELKKISEQTAKKKPLNERIVSAIESHLPPGHADAEHDNAFGDQCSPSCVVCKAQIRAEQDLIDEDAGDLFGGWGHQ